MSYYVYILLCSDGTYYTGVTNDLERRLGEHQTSVNKEYYTSGRLPVKLVFSERFTNPILAIEWEKRIKKWSQKKKKALIEGKYELLPSLSKKQFGK